MGKFHGIYLAKRFYPDADFENFTGIIGRKEVITADGPYGGYERDIYIYDDKWNEKKMVPTASCNKNGEQIWNDVTEVEAQRLVEAEKKQLQPDEQLIYYEKYVEEKMTGPKEFNFCGYDLMDEGFGISAITDCGDLNSQFIHKLNKYGLFNDLTDATDAQKQLYEEHPDEFHAHCDVYGLWRYIKNDG